MARPIASALLVVLSLEACVGWSPRTAPVPAVLAAKKESVLRVTKADGTILRLFEPSVEADSLVGFTRTPAGADSAPYSPALVLTEPVRVALADIKAVDVQRVQIVRTAMLVTAIAIGTVVWAIFAGLYPPGVIT